MMRPSFDEYVAMRSAMLLRFAYLLCGDRHLAEDLVQDVLIRAHRRWPAIEADNPDAYLKRALVHANTSWRRRRASNEVTVSTIRDVAALAAFDDEHASREEVWAMLALLPPKQRAVLVLRYFEDLDDRRIAELVGSSAGAVRVNAHRGLSALRETLAKRALEAPDGAAMAESVRVGAARAARRRRVAAAGLGTAAIVGVLGLVFGLLRPSPSAPPGPPSPSGSASPSPAPTSSPVPTELALVNIPRPPSPDFPFAFSWTPPTLGTPSVNAFTYPDLPGPLTVMTYPSIAGDSELVVHTSSYPDPFIPDWEGDDTPTTVNGHPATLRTTPPDTRVDGLPCVGVNWSQDGVWLAVATCAFEDPDDDLAANDVLRFAESIGPGETHGTLVPSRITGVLLPDGYQITRWDEARVCASAPPPSDVGEVCVAVDSVGSSPDPRGTLLIDGDAATLARRMLVVYRSDGLTVTIEGNEEIDTLADLTAVYRGVSYGS